MALHREPIRIDTIAPPKTRYHIGKKSCKEPEEMEKGKVLDKKFTNPEGTWKRP